jgi:hypothetical protein
MANGVELNRQRRDWNVEPEIRGDVCGADLIWLREEERKENEGSTPQLQPYREG